MSKKKKIFVLILGALIFILYLFPTVFLPVLVPMFFAGINPFKYLPVIPEENSHWIGHTFGFHSTPPGTFNYGIHQIKKASSTTFVVTKDNPGWQINTMWTYRGNQVWLIRVEESNNPNAPTPNGRYNKTVSDALTYPKESYIFSETCGTLPPGQYLKIDRDESLVAFVPDYSFKPQPVNNLWKINLETGKFDTYNTSDIYCYEPKLTGFAP